MGGYFFFIIWTIRLERPISTRQNSHSSVNVIMATPFLQRLRGWKIYAPPARKQGEAKPPTVVWQRPGSEEPFVFYQRFTGLSIPTLLPTRISPEGWFHFWYETTLRGIFIIFYWESRFLPWKNSASIPGPTWAPVNGSWGAIISSMGLAASVIISASSWASSGQSPWEMATR